MSDPVSELTCIICPTGCRIRVRSQGAENDMTGAACERGVEYARAECVEPARVFTGTVRVRGGRRPVVSVRSSGPVARGDLLAVARAAAAALADAPVAIGDLVLSQVRPGVDLLATSTAE